eukprot:TRINITY_DN18282_c1_g1_i1.p1 TRINITY_DN18282_c1_g1~~TRINITY_DN18282_c1_g1_i1.p1  ORF type:complete len:627 (-),score=124.78 TRINITY_DN18282_c1_g1_i1:17-1897(-)
MLPECWSAGGFPLVSIDCALELSKPRQAYLIGQVLEHFSQGGMSFESTMFSNPDAFIMMAQELHSGGHDVLSTNLCARAFSSHGVHVILGAVERRTQMLLDHTENPALEAKRWRDVSDDVVARHVLFDKAHLLEDWLCFLERAGIWTRMGGSPGIVAAQQLAAEACERVAAASCLRERYDHASEMFDIAIRSAMNAVPTWGDAEELQKAETDEVEAPKSHLKSFFSKPGQSHQLLVSLADYAVKFEEKSEVLVLISDTAVAFLEAAMKRRKKILTDHPSLLAAPDKMAFSRRCCLSALELIVGGLGTQWLMDPTLLEALKKILRQLSSAALRFQTENDLLKIMNCLYDLSTVTLRAAYVSYSDLRCEAMSTVRSSVMENLLIAEDSFWKNQALPISKSSIERILKLAEDFDDVDCILKMSLSCPSFVLEDLDRHMAESENFRTHAMSCCLKDPALRPLFFRALRRFSKQLPSSLVEDMMRPFPELQWMLNMQDMGDEDEDLDLNVFTSTAIQLYYAKSRAFEALSSIRPVVALTPIETAAATEGGAPATEAEEATAEATSATSERSTDEDPTVTSRSMETEAAKKRHEVLSSLSAIASLAWEDAHRRGKEWDRKVSSMSDYLDLMY